MRKRIEKPADGTQTQQQAPGVEVQTTPTTANREDEIKKQQNDAIAKATSRAQVATNVVDAIADTAAKAFEQSPIEKFIQQQPAPVTPESLAAAADIQKVVETAFSSSSPFGPEGTPEGVRQNLAAGMEFDACWPEEMYGQRGTFCSYRVGPFRARGRVGPGETYGTAFKRVQDELAEIARSERARMKQEFMGHAPQAFG